MKFLEGLNMKISFDSSLLEKVEIPTEFRDGIYFFSNRDEIRDRKSS